jgi:hypothetical protein
MCIPLGISPLFGPVESNEPIAIEARERGEYSAEPLRDDECEDGELSCFIDEYDWLEEVWCGEGGSYDVRRRFGDEEL